MDAVKYVKTLHRLCKSQDGCSECILDSEDGCIAAASRYEGYENAVQIVEQWAKDNPVKTRQSEFLKRFPNADLTRLQPCMIEKDKRSMWCGKYADFGANGCCDECRYAYWNEEVDN